MSETEVGQSYDSSEINRIITITYVSIQVSIGLFVSIVGAFHVRRCSNDYKTNTNAQTETAIRYALFTLSKVKVMKKMPYGTRKKNIGIPIREDVGDIEYVKVKNLDHVDEQLDNSEDLDEDLVAVYEIANESEFWDEPFQYVNGLPLTAAVFAIAKDNNDIVEWLEERGAKLHKNMNSEDILHCFKNSTS